MELAGKKVLFIGDSITQGAGVSSREKRYTDVFGKITGADVYNYGVNGTRIARQRVEVATPSAERDFVMRFDEDIKEAEVDVVVVFGGTNDFGHGDAPLGCFSDRDVYTFYGALHVLIDRFVNKYPEARIVFMTPLHRLSEDSVTNSQGLRCEPLIRYVEAIREVCEYYSIPVLDLYKNSGIQPSVDILREIYMPDGLHPSDKCAERLAHMLEAFLKNL